ncbi:MAG: tRNA (adenine(22)-N(1))-methyltransferase TrmK [Candidatus Dormiibacterota bacterium]
MGGEPRHLGGRLGGVLGTVPRGAASIVDVGAGDGQLAVALARRGMRVVAVERTEAALARLREAAGGTCDCRLGDGLGPLRGGEVEGAAIAGIGARTMIRILHAAPERVRDLSWMVLQPQQEASRLERGLAEMGLAVAAARWAVERRRLYRVLLIRI